MRLEKSAVRNQLLLMLSIGLFAYVGVRAYAEPGPKDSKANGYGIADAKKKLAQIAKALALYREDYPPMPVSERKSYRDAGLPPLLTDLAKPGYRWSLPDGIDTFFTNGGDWVRPGDRGPTFAKTYWAPERDDIRGPMSQYFALRGEKFPVLIDINPTRKKDLASNGRKFSVIILRLDGTIEEKLSRLSPTQEL